MLNKHMTDEQALRAIKMPEVKKQVVKNFKDCKNLEYDNKNLRKEMKKLKKLINTLKVEHMPNMIRFWGLEIGQSIEKLTEIDDKQNYMINPITIHKKKTRKFDNALIKLQNSIEIMNQIIPEWLIKGENIKIRKR